MKEQQPNITKEVYDQICQTIGRHPAETGGILGSSDGGQTIDRYYFDFSAQTTGDTYTPDTAVLNCVIAQWNAQDTELVGFVHSHPTGCISPSEADFHYAKEIKMALNISGKFFLPIVQVENPANGQIKLYPYALESRLQLCNQPIAVAKTYQTAAQNEQLDSISKARFDRIASLYPLDALKRKTAVCIGVGGARGFVVELARSGVGNFVLIEGDTYAAVNIATQQAYASEIGRSKVEVIKERILDINPAVNVTAVPRFLDDAITDKEFSAIVGQTLRESPQDVLICGCTDNFFAQARAAALAFKFGTPYLAAQLYQGGLAAEICFSYPGVTNNGCPRCVLKSRYEAYRNGYQNNVTTAGAPIFATTRVNATKGQIALMLLLYHEGGSVYSDLLDQVADRNFVMIRMSPLAESTLGLNIFSEAVNADSGLCFFDETVWIPQTPETGCPLCGGTGDLPALKGRIRDTRTDW